MLRQHWERIHQYLGDWHAVLGSALQVGGVDNPIHRLNKIPPKLPPFCRPPKKRAHGAEKMASSPRATQASPWALFFRPEQV
ncbi:MAG TPA: hypothetical protein VGQ81_02455 [Acidobacteriota bacterium]|nr:hypothetical protein [Acidobacteriota bacterium]